MRQIQGRARGNKCLEEGERRPSSEELRRQEGVKEGFGFLDERNYLISPNVCISRDFKLFFRNHPPY